MILWDDFTHDFDDGEVVVKIGGFKEALFVGEDGWIVVFLDFGYLDFWVRTMFGFFIVMFLNAELSF